MIKLNKILNESQQGYYLRWKDWSDKPEYNNILSEFEKMKKSLENYLDYDVVFRGFNRKNRNEDLLYVSDEDRYVKLGGYYSGQSILKLFWDMMKKKFSIESSAPIFGTFWYDGAHFFGNPMLFIPVNEFKMYQSDICKDLSNCLENTLRKKVGKEKEDENGIRYTPPLTDDEYKQVSEELYKPLVDSFHEIKNKNEKLKYNDILMGNKNYWLLSVDWINNLPTWMKEKIKPGFKAQKIGYGMTNPANPKILDNLKYKDVYNIIEYTMKYMKWSKDNFKSWLKSKESKND
jgi:hypothetical protein